MEGYHPDRLHKGIHDFAPSSNVSYEPFERGGAAIAGTIRTLNIDGGFNPTARAIFPVIPTLTEDERWTQVFAYVPPSLLIGVQPDSAFWFTVQPTTVDRHTLTMAYIFPKSTTELPLFPQLLDTAVHGVELFNNQDLPANTAIQVGMRSRFAPRGRFSWQESVLAQFNTWLLDRFESHERRSQRAEVTA
jgi:ring hydroxylating enzyme alpha subunit